jgi:hypothetical protein
MASGTTTTLQTVATGLPNRGVAVEVDLPCVVELAVGNVVRAGYSHLVGTAQTVDFIMTRVS